MPVSQGAGEPILGAKSIKALNHQEHEEHKGKEKLFFVLFPCFQSLLRRPSLGIKTGPPGSAIRSRVGGISFC